MATLLEDARPFVRAETRARLETLVNSLRSSQYTVVTVGEFKDGKSSLVNALARRPGLMPVEVDIATSLPGSVGYGPRECAHVYFTDDKVREVGLGELAKYVTERGNPGNQLDVREVEVQLPDEHLRGIVYADTPGLGTVNPAHTAVTMEYVVRADALLFVLSAESPMLTTQLDFLSGVAPVTDAIVVAVTKIDAVPDPTSLIEDAKAKISARLDLPADALEIHGVSAMRLARGLKRNDPELVAESGVLDLEKAIWRVVTANAARAFALQAGEHLTRELDLAATPLSNELMTRRAGSGTKQAEIARNLEDLQRRADSLGREAEWRTELSRAFDQLQVDVEGRFGARLQEARNALEGYLVSPALLEDPPAIGANVIKDVRMALAAAEAQMRGGVTRVVTKLRRQTSLDVNDPALVALSFDPVESLTAPVLAEPTLSRKLMEAGPQAVAGGKTFRKVGLLVSSVGVTTGLVLAAPVVIAGGAIGLAASQAVGLVAGMNVGLAGVREKQTARRKDAVRSAVTPFFTDNAERARGRLHDSLEEARLQVEGDIETRLAEERTAIADALASVERVRHDTRDADREAELQNQLNEIGELRRRASALLGPVLALGEAAGHVKNAQAPQAIEVV